MYIIGSNEYILCKTQVRYRYSARIFLYRVFKFHSNYCTFFKPQSTMKANTQIYTATACYDWRTDGRRLPDSSRESGVRRRSSWSSGPTHFRCANPSSERSTRTPALSAHLATNTEWDFTTCSLRHDIRPHKQSLASTCIIFYKIFML